MKIESERCKTKYPIFLCHGAGFRDDSPFYNYWGRIPKSLMKNGSTIGYSGQDAWGNVSDCAEVIKRNLLDFLEKTGAEKVNIIAHSKGGLEARYMINELDMGKHVASLTTISTSHHGTRTVELLMKLPEGLLKFAAKLVNLHFKILGDKKPDFYNTCRQFTKSYCKEFNRKYAIPEDIYCQSYATKMKSPFSDLLMFLPYTVVYLIEGPNDGLVPVDSVKWGNFKGVLQPKYFRGISHADSVDLWRMKFPSFDMKEVYLNMAEELKEKGF